MSDMGRRSPKTVHRLCVAYWPCGPRGFYRSSPAGPNRGSECTVGLTARARPWPADSAGGVAWGRLPRAVSPAQGHAWRTGSVLLRRTGRSELSAGRACRREEGCEMRHAGSSHPVSFRPVGSRSFSPLIPGNYFLVFAELNCPPSSGCVCVRSHPAGSAETFLPQGGICPAARCPWAPHGAMVELRGPTPRGAWRSELGQRGTHRFSHRRPARGCCGRTPDSGREAVSLAGFSGATESATTYGENEH